MNARPGFHPDFFDDVAHLSPKGNSHKAHNRVAGEVRHFGGILVIDEWQALADGLPGADACFVIAPFHDETRIFAP
ncbi:MAG: hypothetical protein KGJ49_11520 [Alphaproteobacteria bacterium]|nr:hypothetical protein [Alphaproteobacteria bacterium]